MLALDFVSPALTVIGMRAGCNWPLAACAIRLSFAATGRAPVVAESAPAASERTPTNVTVLGARNLSLPKVELVFAALLWAASLATIQTTALNRRARALGDFPPKEN